MIHWWYIQPRMEEGFGCFWPCHRALGGVKYLWFSMGGFGHNKSILCDDPHDIGTFVAQESSSQWEKTIFVFRWNAPAIADCPIFWRSFQPHFFLAFCWLTQRCDLQLGQWLCGDLLYQSTSFLFPQPVGRWMEIWEIHYTYTIGWLDYASSVESSGDVFVAFFSAIGIKTTKKTYPRYCPDLFRGSCFGVRFFLDFSCHPWAFVQIPRPISGKHPGPP